MGLVLKYFSLTTIEEHIGNLAAEIFETQYTLNINFVW